MRELPMEEALTTQLYVFSFGSQSKSRENFLSSDHIHVALSGDFAVGWSWLSNTFDHIYIGIKPFTTQTDHKSLQWLQSFKHPEGQVTRWLQTLAEYQFTVVWNIVRV